jgi:hypothetical protein
MLHDQDGGGVRAAAFDLVLDPIGVGEGDRWIPCFG